MTPEERAILLAAVTKELTQSVYYTADMSETDTATLATLANQAVELTTGYVGNSTVPVKILEYAAVEVARELHTRRGAPGGVLSPFGDAAPVRLARDPLKAAYPILAPYVGGGFA